MAAWNRRNRILSIRLSDDELRQLKLVSQDRGARSVSDLLREAMVQLVGGPHARNGIRSVPDEELLLARVHEMDQRITALQGEVSRLSAQVNAS